MKWLKIFIPVLLVIATIAFAAKKADIEKAKIEGWLSSASTPLTAAKGVISDTGFVGPGSVPIGGMVAVMPNTHANAWQPPASCTTVKDGFVRAGYSGSPCTVPIGCTDCIIPGGTALPNMNTADLGIGRTTGAYMKGADTSGGTGGANSQATNVIVGPHADVQVPPHNHNTFALNAAGQGGGGTTTTGDGDHSHSPVVGVYVGAGSYVNGGLALNANPVSNDANAIWQASFGAHSAHGHTVPDHTHALSAVSGTVGNQTGSNGDYTMSVSVSAHSVSNNPVNNEPAYVQVVWVIRVK